MLKPLDTGSFDFFKNAWGPNSNLVFLSIISFFTIVWFTKPARSALFTPYFIPCYFGMILEILITFHNIPINGFLCHEKACWSTWCRVGNQSSSQTCYLNLYPERQSYARRVVSAGVYTAVRKANQKEGLAMARFNFSQFFLYLPRFKQSFRLCEASGHCYF